MEEHFRRFASWVSRTTGHAYTFMLAISAVIAWWVLGLVFGMSDAWQLAINTLTTIITFLMVFVLQNTQNRDSQAIHVKLDELLRAVAKARTSLVDVEELPDEELQELVTEFHELGEHLAKGDDPPTATKKAKASAAGRKN